MGNEKFIELATKKLVGEISQEETAELQHILDTEPSYKQKYDALALYWKKSESPYTNNTLAFNKIQSKIKKIEQEGVPVESIESIISIAPAPAKNNFKMWRIAAAVLVFAICGTVLTFYYNPFKTGEGKLTQTITRSGQKSVLTLTDGTKVTLNSQSTLKYPASFNGDTREVTLIGEAFFDVKKDHKHPFIIHTGKMSIKVLGTAFNVKSYPKDPVIETTLLRGAIEVLLDDRPSDRIFLKPNEKLIVKHIPDTDLKPVTDIKPGAKENTSNPQYVLTTPTQLNQNDSTFAEVAWTKNQLVFRNERFAQIAEKMERWYGVNIVFQKDYAMNYNFTGVFEKQTVTEALDILKGIEKFHYKVAGSSIYIY